MDEPAWTAVADGTGIGPGTAVLDVGCGTGGFCALAAGRGAAVHGVDGMPDRIAGARRRVPAGDFRVGLMEELPWDAGAFDVVTGFNAFQYAFDIRLALAEARRVARPGGRLAVCKYGPPADNEFFAFLGALDPDRLGIDGRAAADPVEQAIGRLQLEVVATGEVPAVMRLAGDEALAAAVAAPRGSVVAAAAPYRQPDGSYRFVNRYRYWIAAT